MTFVIGMGLLAAFLVNDTIALLGIPLVIYVARHAGIRPVVLLVALAFGITVGSVMTPIGNPQNLLIATERYPDTLYDFSGAIGGPDNY